MTMGLLGGVSLVGCAVLLWWATAAAAAGRLPRNASIGIRTRATTASDAAWVAGHRAALSPARAVAIVSGLLGVAMAATSVVAGTADPGAAVITLFVLGYGVMGVGTVVAARTAERGARGTDG